MENTELREFDLSVVERWGELIHEQRREMYELGVPYMQQHKKENDGINDGKEEAEQQDDENRKMILSFIEDTIIDTPPYLIPSPSIPSTAQQRVSQPLSADSPSILVININKSIPLTPKRYQPTLTPS